MSERIDYVKVLYRGNPDDGFAWKERQQVLILDYCEPRRMRSSQVASFSRAYDRENGQWLEYLEIWGEAADHYFTEMNTTDRSNVVRVDYRSSFDRLHVRMETILHVVKANKKRTRRTVTQIDSPPRAKKDGRDAGGEMLAVGAKGTKRRVALYKRGNEPWALEVQFGQDMPMQLHQDATMLYLNTPGMDYYTAYMKVAYQAFEETVRDYLHYSFDQITGAELAQHEQSALDYQENFLGQFDVFWAGLDDNARATVREKVIAMPDFYDTIRYEPVEPDDLWEGHDAA